MDLTLDLFYFFPMLRIELIELTQNKIDQAWAISGFLVKKFGDAYLPIFQRLQSERDAFMRKEADRIKAFEIAQKIEKYL